jgi:hypothetical protein
LGAPLKSRCASSKKKTSLGLSRSPTSGKLLEQLGEQPEQEGRVEPRIGHQLIGGQHVDDAAPVAVGPHQVVDIERRLAKEQLALLVLQHQQLHAGLRRPTGRRGDVAVFASSAS